LVSNWNICLEIIFLSKYCVPKCLVCIGPYISVMLVMLVQLFWVSDCFYMVCKWLWPLKCMLLSISSTLNIQIFRTNVVFSSYVWLGAKNSYGKRVRKTLLKLTPGCATFVHVYPYRHALCTHTGMPFFTRLCALIFLNFYMWKIDPAD